MNKATKAKILREFKNEDMQHCLLNLMLQCWNDETPHFGGCGPHRYDGNSKTCAYCNRPKNWKPVNAGYIASQILYGEEDVK